MDYFWTEKLIVIHRLVRLVLLNSSREDAWCKNAKVSILTAIKSSQCMYTFSKVAPTYNEIRTTDPEPILYIKERLIDRDLIQAIDIGCGSGRYDLILCKTIPGIELICSDVNESMVMEASRYLKSHGVDNFSTLHGDISMLELEHESMDCVLTFNAIHHFEPVTFLCKAANALREGGYVFIYIRLRNQNARNIWGRFFPEFSKTETRLYDLHQVEQWMTSTDMRLTTIEFFRFKRITSLARMLHEQF